MSGIRFHRYGYIRSCIRPYSPHSLHCIRLYSFCYRYCYSFQSMMYIRYTRKNTTVRTVLCSFHGIRNSPPFLKL